LTEELVAETAARSLLNHKPEKVSEYMSILAADSPRDVYIGCTVEELVAIVLPQAKKAERFIKKNFPNLRQLLLELP